MRLKTWQSITLNTITYVLAIIIFFPIIWTLLTSFKTEREAFNFPPSFIPVFSFEAEAPAADEAVAEEANDEAVEEEGYSIFYEATLNNYRRAIFDADFATPLINTMWITLLSTFAALLLGIPAAYALAYKADKRSNFTLLWLISTRMLPPAGVIVPLFLLARDLSLLDTRAG
ncbi:MAG: hypothetical protein AAF653_01790, partial [Chloroflexota bacterium]